MGAESYPFERVDHAVTVVPREFQPGMYPEPDVLRDAQVREQVVVLEQGVDRASVRRQAEQGSPLPENVPRVRRDEPPDEVQQRTLPPTRSARAAPTRSRSRGSARSGSGCCRALAECHRVPARQPSPTSRCNAANSARQSSSRSPAVTCPPPRAGSFPCAGRAGAAACVRRSEPNSAIAERSPADKVAASARASPTGRRSCGQSIRRQRCQPRMPSDCSSRRARGRCASSGHRAHGGRTAAPSGR